MVTTRAATRSSSATPTPTPVPVPVPVPVPAARSPAGNALEIDPVSKARTITHMNKDHSDDMSAILRHFAALTEKQAAAAEMLDLDLATITLRSASGVHHVPVTPPMSGWNDRRARLVDMTVEARKALGMEVGEGPAQAQAQGQGRVQFYPPQGVGIVSFTGVLWYFVSAAFYFTGNITPGSPFWRFVEAVYFPGGPRLYAWLVKMILVPMLGIHAFEAFYVMANNRLAPRGVQIGSVMWFLWVGCTFFEGMPAWKRWDRKVTGKEKGQ